MELSSPPSSSPPQGPITFRSSLMSPLYVSVGRVGGQTSEGTWSNQNHLQLNVTKVRQLVVHLKRIQPPVVLVLIHGVNVDIVDNNK